MPAIRPTPLMQRIALAKDPLEAARVALRTLQYDKAVALLRPAGQAGNAKAQLLLGLIYLNGVGVPTDPAAASALLRSAADRGDGEAAYVLAGELARDPKSVSESRQWLERAASLGYARAADALKSDRPLLDREGVSAGDPALFGAWVIDCARRNDAAELQRLGTAAAGVRDEFERTALMHAADSGAPRAVQTLLELGADPRAADRVGTTALMLAVGHADTQIAEILLAHGADPDAADAEQRSAMFYAARANQSAAIDVLAHAGGHLDALDRRGYSALDVATVAGSEAAATQLRALGAKAYLVKGKPQRQSGKFDAVHPGEIYRGWQELALAIARDDASTVQRLLAAGADANARLPQGDTLLQAAADARALDCISLLLAHGADPAAADHTGHSVLWLAASRDDQSLIKSLLGDGVKPDVHQPHEQAPLLAAIHAGQTDNARQLLEAGASVDDHRRAGAYAADDRCRRWAR